MGLRMKEKQAITAQIASRYQQGSKRDKQRILDEFTQLTGYHRKYAIHLLSTWGKECIQWIHGQRVRFVVGAPRRRKKREGRRVYDERVREAVRRVWELFDYLCGKRLAVLMRANLDMLIGEAELGIERSLREKLLQVSPATIDRMLRPERKRLALKGRSRTRAGSLLRHQIPIRVFYPWEERRVGFCELDTVSHDGGSSRGEFCQTLTLTDVASGWVELRALRNRAHRWVKEALEQIASTLPFPLRGIDSDNGGEFLNQQVVDWCKTHQVTFTRARPYRKNDNCFVEQKNDVAVRRYVGYARYDTDSEYTALQEVYPPLCLLLNFFYPSVRLVQKDRTGCQVKKRYDSPKTPYQRLLEDQEVDERVKETLRQQASQLHLLKVKRLVDQAVDRLIQLQRQKVHGTGPHPANPNRAKEDIHKSTGFTKKEKKKQKEKENTTSMCVR